MVKVGQKAPDFAAQAYVKGQFKEVRLSDYQGKWVILFFYPLDFTFVCPTELEAFAEDHEEFRSLGAEVLAASVDSVYSHKAWFETDARLKKVAYPIISDINKEISRQYGVLDEDKGVALRGTFIIDPEGILQHMTINNLDVGRSTEETLRTLKALQTGGLCPANWRPGEPLLKAG